VIVGVASLCTAQNQRCNTMPTQMSASIAQLIFDTNECVYFKDIGMIFIDYTAGKARSDLSISSNNQNTNLSSWIDYNDQIEYILDRDTGDCTSMPYKLPLGSNKIPSSATYTGSVFLGSQQIDTYFMDNFPGFNDISVELSVTSETCLPLSGTFFNTTNGNTLWLAESLWNVVNTVPPYIFDLPDACNDALRKRSIEASEKFSQLRRTPKLPLV